MGHFIGLSRNNPQNPAKKSVILLAQLHYNTGVFPSDKYLAAFRAKAGRDSGYFYANNKNPAIKWQG